MDYARFKKCTRPRRSFSTCLIKVLGQIVSHIVVSFMDFALRAVEEGS
jgi:hypothetical protein